MINITKISSVALNEGCFCKVEDTKLKIKETDLGTNTNKMINHFFFTIYSSHEHISN